MFVSFGVLMIGEAYVMNDFLQFLASNLPSVIDGSCKDQFRLRSNTGMDPGPRSPNNEFVECGKKS